MKSRRLFDHFVGERKQLVWNLEAQRLGGLEVDHQLELDRSLNGKLARLRALEDAIGVGCCTPIIVDEIISVGQQATDFSVEPVRIDCREAVARRQQCNIPTMVEQESIRHHDKAAIRLAC